MEVSEKSVLGWLTEKGKAKRSIALLSILLIPLVASWLILPSANAMTISSPRDCDNNAVVSCGALSVTELQRKFNNDSDTRAILKSFGISSSDIQSMDSSATSGTVTRSGRVMVNGKTVATNAITAGRQNMSGSQRVHSGNTTFFRRPPSVSFAQSSLPAFVVMNNGRFQFAIIASCGNPVTATPVVRKAITRNRHQVTQRVVQRPTPQAPTQPQAQEQSQSVIVSPPVVAAAPQPTPVPVPVPQKGPVIIPNTGAGDTVGFGSFVALVGGSLHYLYRRSRFGLR
jgi:hypothetical protein